MQTQAEHKQIQANTRKDKQITSKHVKNRPSPQSHKQTQAEHKQTQAEHKQTLANLGIRLSVPRPPPRRATSAGSAPRWPSAPFCCARRRRGRASSGSTAAPPPLPPSQPRARSPPRPTGALRPGRRRGTSQSSREPGFAGAGQSVFIWRAGHGSARLWKDRIRVFPKTYWATPGPPYERRLASAGETVSLARRRECPPRRTAPCVWALRHVWSIWMGAGQWSVSHAGRIALSRVTWRKGDAPPASGTFHPDPQTRQIPKYPLFQLKCAFEVQTFRGDSVQWLGAHPDLPLQHWIARVPPAYGRCGRLGVCGRRLQRSTSGREKRGTAFTTTLARALWRQAGSKGSDGPAHGTGSSPIKEDPAQTAGVDHPPPPAPWVESPPRGDTQERLQSICSPAMSIR
eukprot:gene15419-biopygen12725